MENKNKGSNQNQQSKRAPAQGPGMQNSSRKLRSTRKPAGERRTAAAPGNKRAATEKSAGRPFSGEKEKKQQTKRSSAAKTVQKAAGKSTRMPQNGGKKGNNAARRSRSGAVRKAYTEEPIIRRDDYGDGFYTDEVAMKRNAAMQAEEEARIQEELSREPFSRKTRKAINIAVCGAILLVILITGIVLSLTVFFKSEQIEVEGSAHYSNQEIIDASGLTLGENLFLSDKKTGEEKIKQALPYVEEAKIDIRIPDTMVIHITEAQPAYVIAQGKEFVVISSEGRVLERISKNTYDAPVIKGCTLEKAEVGNAAQVKNKNIMPILNEVTEVLQKNEFNGIREIDVSSTANITLNYADRIQIVLGMPEDIDYKIRTAQTIINQKLAQTDMGVLDVSACNGSKKASYYNPDNTLYATKPATEPATAATEPVTDYTWQDSGDGYTDSYSAEGYDYDDGYSDEGYYYDDGYTDGTDGYNAGVYA